MQFFQGIHLHPIFVTRSRPLCQQSCRDFEAVTFASLQTIVSASLAGLLQINRQTRLQCFCKLYLKVLSNSDWYNLAACVVTGPKTAKLGLGTSPSQFSIVSAYGLFHSSGGFFSLSQAVTNSLRTHVPFASMSGIGRL